MVTARSATQPFTAARGAAQHGDVARGPRCSMDRAFSVKSPRTAERAAAPEGTTAATPPLRMALPLQCNFPLRVAATGFRMVGTLRSAALVSGAPSANVAPYSPRRDTTRYRRLFPPEVIVMAGSEFPRAEAPHVGSREEAPRRGALDRLFRAGAVVSAAAAETAVRALEPVTTAARAEIARVGTEATGPARTTRAETTPAATGPARTTRAETTPAATGPARQGWVSWDSNKELRVRTNRARVLFVVDRIDESRLDAHLRQPLREKLVYATVDIALRHDMVAALEQRHQRGCDRTHTRGERQSRVYAFQCGDCFLGPCLSDCRNAYKSGRCAWPATVRRYR